MLKKSVAFGLLAASLIIAPSAAFADTQSQNNNQYNEQNGAALDGSFNEQNAENVNNQRQVINRKRRHRGYGKRYYGGRKYRGSRRANQEQDNVQGNVQSGAAEFESENRQNASNRNRQTQRNRR
ncbi:hypothetical protein [Mastigocoleus sp. MO_188.B34]|uniref:hypothetical protein n=1 Tax=Mastigocoleus sp. MO_188.B34 TaxID=3036635 RepID=UPI00261D8BB0|nr:hypothetical protein [Mastigocoleus sp. MO_188.B34]MDJ0697918.1 hypothetical protein [Mastigocoleus sp. MO_188.B34]